MVRYSPIQQAIPASSEIFSDVAYVLVAPQQAPALPLRQECFLFATPRIPGWSD